MNQNTTDFGKIFSDLISSCGSGNGGVKRDKPLESEIDEDEELKRFYECESKFSKLKKDYDELKSDFEQYKKRVQNTLETEKRSLKRELFRNFINGFVVFLVNTYKGKNASGGKISDVDYLILKKMNDYLTSVGIEPMEDCTGKNFDYRTMDAIMNERNDSVEAGKVSKVLYNGFMMDGEVLIPQKVSVSSLE